jgi:cytochrome b
MTRPLAPPPAAAPSGQGERAFVRVWPPVVRWGHWALAASVIGCLLLHEGGAWHEGLGYAALGLALGRSGLGWLGGARHLRFAAFLRGPAATWAYARALRSGTEPRHLGHNPLGGWMVVALLLAAVLAGASGALYTTDRYWGDDTVYAVHRAAGWSFAVLVPLHLVGVILTSLLQRENLVRAMFSGRKRPAAAGDTGLDA